MPMVPRVVWTRDRRKVGPRRYVFARPGNPWSAWTRWASTPMVPRVLWTRDRRKAGTRRSGVTSGRNLTAVVRRR